MGKKRKKQNSALTEKPLFEGVLFKNDNKYSVEFRKNDGELQTVVKNAEANPDKLIKKIPFVRGIFILVQNVILTLETLEISGEMFGNDTTKETFVDRTLSRLFGRHTNIIVSAVTATVSFVACMFLIIFLPVFLAHFLERYIINTSVIHIIEFVASVFVMLVYLSSFLLFKEVRRMMKYHAAAHMCINCIERGRKLTYKNVASSSRFFDRCTTNYIVFCTLVSVALFVFVRIDSIPLRLLFRLLYIPIATGLFYELYVVIGILPDNIFKKILAFPGIIFQVFTLIKPDDEMITTAIASLDAVFDWREFLIINFPDKYSSHDFGKKKVILDPALNEILSTDKIEEELEKEFRDIHEEITGMNEEELTNEYYEEYTPEEEYEEFEEEYTDEFVNCESMIIEEEYYDEFVGDENTIIEEEDYNEEDSFVGYTDDEIEDKEFLKTGSDDMKDLTKTQPVGIDFADGYGFDPDDEEVDENEMVFEPVNEDEIRNYKEEIAEEDYEEGNVPLFSKEIESIPMPDKLDNLVEFIPEGGVTSRVYNLNTEEIDKNDFDLDDEDIDLDNIIDENGHLTLKDTDAFNRKLDEEYDEIFKRLGLDSDDL